MHNNSSIYLSSKTSMVKESHRVQVNFGEKNATGLRWAAIWLSSWINYYYTAGHLNYKGSIFGLLIRGKFTFPTSCAQIQSRKLCECRAHLAKLRKLLFSTRNMTKLKCSLSGAFFVFAKCKWRRSWIISSSPLEHLALRVGKKKQKQKVVQRQNWHLWSQPKFEYEWWVTTTLQTGIESVVWLESTIS